MEKLRDLATRVVIETKGRIAHIGDYDSTLLFLLINDAIIASIIRDKNIIHAIVLFQEGNSGLNKICR
jgi:hypothetical protein